MRDVVEVLKESCQQPKFDSGAHGALADVLEDADAREGRPHGANGLSAALRWMAKTGFRPALRKRRRVQKPYAWAWWHTHSERNHGREDPDRADILAHPESCLPPVVFMSMCNAKGGFWVPDHWYFPSWEKAVMVLDGGVRLLVMVAAGEVRPAGKEAKQ